MYKFSRFAGLAIDAVFAFKKNDVSGFGIPRSNLRFFVDGRNVGKLTMWNT